MGTYDLWLPDRKAAAEPDPDTPAADGLKLLASRAATRAVDNTDTRDAHDVR